MISIFDILAAGPPVAEAEGGGVVSDIAATFKIQWPYFLSQCVSFLIVCALLFPRFPADKRSSLSYSQSIPSERVHYRRINLIDIAGISAPPTRPTSQY